MGKKLNKVYDALLDGASQGLKDKALYDFVVDECPKASSKRIVKASLFALSDPDVRDRDVLETIYALAISYRLSSLGVEDDAPDADDDEGQAPTVSADLKAKLENSTSKLTTIPALDTPIMVPPDQPVH